MTTINIASYGCKYGEYEGDNVFVVPCHDIPNPHSNERLRDMNGKDMRLQHWVLGHQSARSTLNVAYKAIAKAMHPTNQEDTFTLAFECIGGRHRSASLAEVLGGELTRRGLSVNVTHRDLNRNRY